MSAYGAWPTSTGKLRISAFGVEADMAEIERHVAS